jgi:hypothetical protein
MRVYTVQTGAQAWSRNIPRSVRQYFWSLVLRPFYAAAGIVAGLSACPESREGERGEGEGGGGEAYSTTYNIQLKEV